MRALADFLARAWADPGRARCGGGGHVVCEPTAYGATAATRAAVAEEGAPRPGARSGCASAAAASRRAQAGERERNQGERAGLGDGLL